MAISLLVNVQDTATDTLVALDGVMTPLALSKNIGEAEVILFQNHFRNAPTNKYGYPSTGFWQRAARATNYTASNAGPVINVNQIGVRQRLQGGDIFPVEKNKLAIPAREEAYGKAPSEFDNLTVAWHNVGGQRSAFALVEAAASQITYGKKIKGQSNRDFTTHDLGGGVFYWLVNSVHQNPYPTVIPDQRDITQVARETLDSIVQRIGKGGAA
jgi:hypothetical protein